MPQRDQPELTESGRVVRLQQAVYFAGTICWLIIVAGLYLISGNKPGLGPTVIMICLGPLVLGFFIAGWCWIIRVGLHNLFCWCTFCVSLALLITLPVAMFMDDIAGANSGLILTVLMTAACGGFMIAWATNKSGIRKPPRP